MYLTEQHIIKQSDARYALMDELCFRSKNLYNAALYDVRQHYINHKKYLNRYEQINQFTVNKQQDYQSLPAKVSQQSIIAVHQSMSSFFAALKAKNSNGGDNRVNLPKYLPKKGRYVVTFTTQAISKKLLRDGTVKLSLPLDLKDKFGIDLTFHTSHKVIKMVRIVPKLNHIAVEIVYEKKESPQKGDNGRYLSIDMGLNNLAACVSNVVKPIIINGKPLKDINAHWNKQVSKLTSENQKLKRQTKNGKKVYITNRIKSITAKRNNKIKDYLHKASRYIINYAVSNDLNTIIIGYNKGWKQGINIGHKNNQKFVNIPFAYFKNMIEYKAKLVGIHVIINEESYTSKCSFIDNEPIQKYTNYLGKRIKRGLFRSNKGITINADANGAFNIMRKNLSKYGTNILFQNVSNVSPITKSNGVGASSRLLAGNIIVLPVMIDCSHSIVTIKQRGCQ